MVCFDLYGQPGCWQDASVLFGIENLILATYDDPEWVARIPASASCAEVEFCGFVCEEPNLT